MRPTSGRAARAEVVTAAVGAAIALSAAERWTRSTRATAAERTTPLPGDEEVPAPDWQATRAATIRAAPEEVWPWLVQMGFPTRRAGWYAPDWLDRVVWRIRERSAEEIRPELQGLRVGDRVPDSPDGSAFFKVARLEPARTLVLSSTTHVLPYTDLRSVGRSRCAPCPRGPA